MANEEGDFDLLLSLQDKVVETPPGTSASFLRNDGKLSNKRVNNESAKQSQGSISSEKTSILKSSTMKLDPEGENQQPDPRRKN